MVGTSSKHLLIIKIKLRWKFISSHSLGYGEGRAFYRMSVVGKEEKRAWCWPTSPPLAHFWPIKKAPNIIW